MQSVTNDASTPTIPFIGNKNRRKSTTIKIPEVPSLVQAPSSSNNNIFIKAIVKTLKNEE
jgi:hypothetical protein